MSQCRRCNCESFTLDRNSGVMTCDRCGEPNYVGSPSNYSGEFDKKDKGFDSNSIFRGTKE